MIARLRQWVDDLRAFFARLTQREQLAVVAVGSLLTVLSLLGGGLGVGRAIAREEARVRSKTLQLGTVLALQNDYRARQAERTQRLQALRGSPVRLVSLVEESARQAGFEANDLRPVEGEPNADGIALSHAKVRVVGLSADRLQEFLNAIEQSPGVVVISWLKIIRRYSRGSEPAMADVEMTVTTYKARA